MTIGKGTGGKSGNMKGGVKPLVVKKAEPIGKSGIPVTMGKKGKKCKY